MASSNRGEIGASGCGVIRSVVKIGIATRCLGRSLPQALHVVAQLGAHGVGFDARHELRPEDLSRTGLREIRRRLDDLRLTVASLCYFTRGGLSDRTRSEERVMGIHKAMRLAYGLGCHTLLTNPGSLPDPNNDAAWQPLRETIQALTSFAEHEGVTVAVRTTCEDAGRLAAAVAASSHEGLGVDLHPAGLVARGESVDQAVEQLLDSVVHVTAADAVRDLATGTSHEVELGRGMADWPAIFASLAERNYQGWVTIEQGISRNPEPVRQAVQYLASVVD